MNNNLKAEVFVVFMSPMEDAIGYVNKYLLTNSSELKYLLKRSIVNRHSFIEIQSRVATFISLRDSLSLF